MSNVPGMNVYAMARSLVGGSIYTYFQNTGVTTNARGLREATFAAGVERNDSVQPVPVDLYERLGLDLSRRYIVVYTSSTLDPVGRDGEGDEIEFNGNRYQVQSDTDWSSIDGWKGTLAILLEPSVAPVVS